METTLANIPEQEETCPKCGQSLLPGQLITGQAWNGDGGAHIRCEDYEVTNVTLETQQDGEGIPNF